MPFKSMLSALAAKRTVEGVTWVTAISVVGSLVATLAIGRLFGIPIDRHPATLAIATFVPLVIAGPVSLAMFRLVRELERSRDLAMQLSRTDPLTGVLNRRSFREVAQRELERARHGGTSFCVLLIDVDNFKRVNDTYGHDVGDSVLRTVAQAAERILRPSDLVARWGGEEFVVALSALDEASTLAIARRLCGAVSSSPLDATFPALRVTVSVGIARSRLDGETLDMMLVRADRAMYSVKRSGKNSVAVEASLEAV